MTTVTEKDIGNTITALVKRFDDNLANKLEAELEEYWHFVYDIQETLEHNIYLFCSRLESYKRFCRQWEEINNGACCVVERVRDKYLMPKIKEFATQIRHV